MVQFSQGLTGKDEHVHAVDGDQRNNAESSGAQSQSCAHEGAEEFRIICSNFYRTQSHWLMLGKLSKITPNRHTS